jgi:hypothetical protein
MPDKKSSKPRRTWLYVAIVLMVAVVVFVIVRRPALSTIPPTDVSLAVPQLGGFEDLSAILSKIK